MKQRRDKSDEDDDLFNEEFWQNMVRARSKCECSYWARKLGEHFAKRTLERIEAAWDAAGLTVHSSTARVVLQ